MHFIINKMKDLDNLIQKFIKDERIKLIKQLCNNETSLIGKETHLINKYSDCLNIESNNIESNNIEMEICDEPNNPQYLNISNESVFEIDNLSNEFDKLSLKELQKICFENGVDIYKFSQISGNKINKSKKELLDLINSNIC